MEILTNEYEYEYNVVGRVKLAVDQPRPFSRTLRVVVVVVVVVVVYWETSTGL